MAQSLSLKERQRKEREDLILQVTQEILFEQGYHQMSMDEIASRVGIAKGTLYLHFQHKEDLVAELFARRLHSFQEMVEQAMATPGSPRERLVCVLDSMLLYLSDKHAHFMYAYHNNLELASLLQAKLSQPFTCIRQGIATLLEEGKQAGEFEASLPTFVMVQTFFSVLSPLAYTHVLRENPQLTPEELSGYLKRIYFQGITAHR